MNETKELSLIDGEFAIEDAQEILMTIFSSKISFHQLKNFGSLERYGKEDAIAKKRIPHLHKEVKKLKTILSKAKAKKQKLEIHAVIKITFHNNEKLNGL
jgi:hypothetical protein